MSFCVSEAKLYQPRVDWGRLHEFQRFCRQNTERRRIDENMDITCVRILAPDFENEPNLESYTVHHWSGSWYNKNLENGGRRWETFRVSELTNTRFVLTKDGMKPRILGRRDSS